MSLEGSVDDEIIKISQELKALESEAESYKRELLALKQKRDEKNAQVSDLIKKGKENKELRDKANEETKKYKALREENSSKLRTIYESLNKIKEATKNKDITSSSEIEKKIDNIEWKLETEVLSLDKERQLVDIIKDLKKDLKESKNYEALSKEARFSRKDLDTLKKNSEEFHKKVLELSDESTKYHERMIYYFNSSEGIKKEADTTHKNYLEKKKYVDELYDKIRELRAKIKGLEINSRKTEKQEKEKKIKEKKIELSKKSEDILEKFKNGEKLTLDELKILQAGGNI